MRKKHAAVMVASIFALLILLVLFVSRFYKEQEPTPQEQAYEIMERIEGALEEMDKGWEKKSSTEILPFDLKYEGGQIITYYVCTTTFYEEEPLAADGLSSALKGVIDPESAEKSTECKVSGLDAMRYEKDGRAFLCWTVSPEISLAIEYGIGEFTDKEILEMAESVPANLEG